MCFRSVSPLALVLGLAAAPPPLEAAQFIVSGGATDYFNSIGLTSNGVVLIAHSRNGGPGFFDWSGGGFTFTPVAPLLPGGLATAWRITRDGRFIVGDSESPNTGFGFEATFWNVDSPNSPTGLGFLGGSFKDSLGLGIGVQSNAPVIVGGSTSPTGTVSYKWTAAGGMFALPQTGLPSLTSSAYGITGDGAIWVGNEDPSGINTFRAVVGNSTGVLVLNSLGNPNSQANNISYDGSVVVGKIGQQAAFWNVGTLNPTLLTLDGNPLIGEALGADGGWVVGRGGSFGWMASVTNGVALTASNWLAQHFGLAVTNDIREATDIFAQDGRLFITFATTTGAALFTTDPPTVEPPAPSLAIAMLPPNQIQLRWPTNRVCVPEATPDLTAPRVWTALTNPAPQLSNSQFTLTLPATNAMKFFRLNCP